MVVHTSNPSYPGDRGKRITNQSQPRQFSKTVCQEIKLKGLQRCGSEVEEHLPRVCKAFSAIPCTRGKKKNINEMTPTKVFYEPTN